jgi:hypothetical protein
MEKLAAIYERKGALFVLAAHQTRAGFWIDDDIVISLRDPTTEELGRAISSALTRSRSGVPTPLPTVRTDQPILKAASVGSWATFMKSSKHVSVSKSDSGFKVTSYRNLGSREGFEPDADLELECETSLSDLGQIVADLMGRTT